MFQIISPTTKVMALTLSVALTWSTMGTIAGGFMHDAEPAQPMAQLPLVVVVGHRDSAINVAQPGADAQKAPAEVKLTTMSSTRQSAAI